MTRRLVMWDVDNTLLRAGPVALTAWQAAFTEVTGQQWHTTPSFAGRTDLDICTEVFAAHDVTGCTPEAFFARYVELIEATAHEFGERGELLPGAREALRGLAADASVVQTLVTGNVPAVATAKVTAFGLTELLDLSVGGYGTDDRVRATLVARSLDRATAVYGEGFAPVVVGDTAFDVAAGLAHGARVIGVATGRTSVDDLARAGAHVVLTDLADTAAVLRVIRSD